MKFVINSEELNRVFKSLKLIVNSKTTIPLLSNIAFNFKDNILFVKASDSEQYLTCQLNTPDKLNVPNCEYLVDFVSLNRFISQLDNQLLVFNFSVNLEVSTENGVYTFPYYVETFITTPIVNNSNKYVVSSNQFIHSLSKVSYAVSDDSLRPVMCGVNIEFGDEITFVASDSHILSKFNTENSNKIPINTILTIKLINILKTLITNNSNITINIDSRNIKLSFDKYVFTSKLIEGEYPNWRVVIPNFEDSFEINRLDFISSIKRVALFSNSHSKLVILSSKNNVLKIEGQDIDFSTVGFEYINISEIYDFKTGFKADYLVSILSNIDSEYVDFYINKENNRPTLITPRHNKSIFTLIMPMQIDTH